MKTELSPEDLTLVKLAKEYSDEDKARALFESLRWPNGPVCPRCDAGEPYKLVPKAGSKWPGRAGLYKCRSCRKQFTATVGTIFEGSHIALSTWLQATFILCSAKKGISAHQLHRMLDVTYKTAWFMAHRLRYAMEPDKPLGRLLGGGVMEMDETFVGGKLRYPKAKLEEMGMPIREKTPVIALLERYGNVRTQVVSNVTGGNVHQFLKANMQPGNVLCTDESPASAQGVGDKAKHVTVNHRSKEYVRKEDDSFHAGINHCESFFSLLKRSIVGAFHHVSPDHLHRYCNEVEFRWNRRKLTDGERTCEALQATVGRRLSYKPLTAKSANAEGSARFFYDGPPKDRKKRLD